MFVSGRLFRQRCPGRAAFRFYLYGDEVYHVLSDKVIPAPLYPPVDLRDRTPVHFFHMAGIMPRFSPSLTSCCATRASADKVSYRLPENEQTPGNAFAAAARISAAPQRHEMTSFGYRLGIAGTGIGGSCISPARCIVPRH